MLLQPLPSAWRIAFCTDSSLVGRPIDDASVEGLGLLGYGSVLVQPIDAGNPRWLLACAARRENAPLRIDGAVLSAVHIVLGALADAQRERPGTDALTLLPDRTATLARLREYVASSARTNVPAALLFIDFNRFKSVNDTFGHARGDELLSSLSQRMRNVLRENEFIGRVGGDEFVVLLPVVDNIADATHAAERLCDAVTTAGEDVSVSIGIALTPVHALSAEELLLRADAAMYRAKRAQSCYAIFDPEWTRDDAYSALAYQAADIAQAFIVSLQPIFEVASGRPTRVEVFPRWSHPRLGLLPPKTFLREPPHRTASVDAWTLTQAMRLGVRWRPHGIERVHVNCRIQDQRDATDLVRILKGATSQERNCISLELQNGGGSADAFADCVRLLREAGVQVGLDGFLARELSLLQLQQLNVSFVKISLGALERREDAQLLDAVTALARAFNWSVMATHVERAVGRQTLQSVGVQFMQGFASGQPLTVQDFDAWISRDPIAS